MKDCMKKRCRQESMSMNKIYLKELGKAVRDGLPVDSLSAKLIPTYKSMYKGLWNQRHKDTPILPKTTFDIDLTDDKYILTNDGKQFKLFDSLDEDRILGYASPTNLEILSKSKQWHADGTFISSPQHYKQLYCIYAWYLDEMHLCLYAFLKKKDTVTYKKIILRNSK
jgi:hypothetical protein